MRFSRGVVYDYALSRVYGYVRDRQREDIGNEDRAHAALVDRELLHPLTIDHLCLVNLNRDLDIQRSVIALIDSVGDGIGLNTISDGEELGSGAPKLFHHGGVGL